MRIRKPASAKNRPMQPRQRALNRVPSRSASSSSPPALPRSCTNYFGSSSSRSSLALRLRHHYRRQRVLRRARDGRRILRTLGGSHAAPLQLYARLEFAVAVSAVIVTLLLSRAAAPFAALENKIGLLAWLLLFVAIAAPAFLMGGTLPVLVRAQSPDAQKVGRTGGILYAANTAGAVFGALLVPFVLVPEFGVRGSAFAAALLNIIIACIAIALDRNAAQNELILASATEVSISSDAKLALALYAVAGGIALGYEVVWSQSLIQFMSTRSFAFAIVLATFLSGLVAGSAVYARFADRVLRTLASFRHVDRRSRLARPRLHRVHRKVVRRSPIFRGASRVLRHF